jgi:hypothetical protein
MTKQIPGFRAIDYGTENPGFDHSSFEFRHSFGIRDFVIRYLLPQVAVKVPGHFEADRQSKNESSPGPVHLRIHILYIPHLRKTNLSLRHANGPYGNDHGR